MQSVENCISFEIRGIDFLDTLLTGTRCVTAVLVADPEITALAEAGVEDNFAVRAAARALRLARGFAAFFSGLSFFLSHEDLASDQLQIFCNKFLR